MQSFEIWNEYSRITMLGTSSYGTVYKAKRKKDNKLVIIKEYLRFQEGATQVYEKDLEYMELLKSEHTVKLIETKQANDNLYIIREYCYGTLEEFIKSHSTDVPIYEIQKILKQLVEPFKKFNENKLIHKNIKPTNILISFKGLKDFIVKLSGIYLCVKEGSEEAKDPIRGNRLLTPPEGLKGDEINMKYDLWSLGTLIYYMIKEKYPFDGERDKVVFDKIEAGIDLNITEDNDLNDLLKKCLQKEVNERISWEQFFNHPFLTKKIEQKKKKKKEVKELNTEEKSKIKEIKAIKNKFNSMRFNDIRRKLKNNPALYRRLAIHAFDSEDKEGIKRLNEKIINRFNEIDNLFFPIFEKAKKTFLKNN